MKSSKFGLKACAASLLFGVCLSNASVIVSETFSYPDGALTDNAAWSAHSGAGNKVIQVSGGAITLQQSSGSGEDVSIKPNAGLPILEAGGTIFASFDVSVSGSNALVYFAHFIRGSTIFDARIFITSFDGSDYTFGLGTGASPTVTWGEGLSFDQSYNLVAAYDFDTGVSTLWVNPASEASDFITVTGVTSSAVEGFGFRQASPASSSTQVIDNLILGTSFTDVSPIPEPGSFAAIAGGLALVSVTALRRRRVQAA